MAKVVCETIEFKLDGRKKSFKLFHNLDTAKYKWELILAEWLKITEVYTEESLCMYINSRTHLTDCRAFTESQYEELKKSV